MFNNLTIKVMAKFKSIIDGQDGKPVFVNPDQVKVVFKYNDCEKVGILLEGGFRIAVNAELTDVVEYLEDITDTIQLHYFDDVKNEDDTTDTQEKKLYKVLVNCPTVNAVNCAVKIMAKNGVIENTDKARAEATRDLLGCFMDNTDSYTMVKSNMSKTDALALYNDFNNTTCINAKVEEI